MCTLAAACLLLLQLPRAGMHDQGVTSVTLWLQAAPQEAQVQSSRRDVLLGSSMLATFLLASSPGAAQAVSGLLPV